MKRRATLWAIFGGWVGALPSRSRAQPAKPKLVALLGQASAQLTMSVLAIIKPQLRQLGWIEGTNVTFDYRSADGHTERLPQLAREVVALKPDVIIVIFSPAALAIRDATKTIPVVASVSDPIGAGLAQSLSRPGGNFTGLSNFNADLGPKLIELLRGALQSTLSHVGVLWNPDNASNVLFLKHLSSVAGPMRVTLLPIEARNLTDIEQALERMSRDGAGAVVIAVDGMIHSHTRRIGELLIRYRLPAIAQGRGFIGPGVLMSYSANVDELTGRMAYYIDRILKGANPAEMPIEQPTRFELVVDLKAAKMLGVTIPQSLLLRADEVVQ